MSMLGKSASSGWGPRRLGLICTLAMWMMRERGMRKSRPNSPFRSPLTCSPPSSGTCVAWSRVPKVKRTSSTTPSFIYTAVPPSIRRSRSWTRFASFVSQRIRRLDSCRHRLLAAWLSCFSTRPRACEHSFARHWLTGARKCRGASQVSRTTPRCCRDLNWLRTRPTERVRGCRRRLLPPFLRTTKPTSPAAACSPTSQA